MAPQDYIIRTIESLAEPITIEHVSRDKLEDAIYARVMSKKFRKKKPGDLCVELTKKAIKLTVEENRPITIFELFGGNKLWRFDEAPEIDWAELFSMTYFVQWMRWIAAVYEPGVEFIYFSQDVSVERLNNIPRSETDEYSKTFIELIEWIKPYLPANIKLTYQRHYDLFADSKDYNNEIEAAKIAVVDENNGKLPEMTDAMKMATELNVRLRPGQSDDPLWREKVELEHQAIFKMKSLQAPMDNPYKIWTAPTYFDDSVVTGSTKRSMAKFWAGVGALEHSGNEYNELILTPKQLEVATFEWHDISIPGLPGKNFAKIRILK